MILTAIAIYFIFYSDISGSNNTPPDNPEINITDNQSTEPRSKPRLKGKLKRAAEREALTLVNSLQFNHSTHVEPSSSNLNLFSVLDNLDASKSESPPSPTGSNDSNKTVKDLVYSVYESSRKRK